MVVVEMTRGPFRVADIYYPREAEVAGFLSNLSFNQIVCLRQMPVALPSLEEATHVPFETSLVDLNSNEQSLLARMNRTCRYQLRKADNLADRIEVRQNDSTACRDFLRLHNEFVSRKRHTERLSERRFEAYRPLSDVLVAYFEGRPICGHVVIRDERVGRVGVLFTVSTRLQGEERSTFISSINRWLHWYEIRQYKSQGLQVYDLCGLGTDTPEKAGIAFFKHSFGGTSVLEHNYVVARKSARMAVRLFYLARRIRSGNLLRSKTTALAHDSSLAALPSRFERQKPGVDISMRNR
jgi:hypothetical protein